MPPRADPEVPAVSAPPRGLALLPGAPAAPTARNTPLPAPGPRCHSSQPAGARAAPDVSGAQGARTPRPSYGRTLASARPAGAAVSSCGPSSSSCAQLPRIYSSALVLPKLEKGKEALKNGCGPFKTCPLPFPFPPSAPFHRLVPKYRGRGRGEGRNGEGEVRRGEA